LQLPAAKPLGHLAICTNARRDQFCARPYYWVAANDAAVWRPATRLVAVMAGKASLRHQLCRRNCRHVARAIQRCRGKLAFANCRWFQLSLKGWANALWKKPLKAADRDCKPCC